MQHYSEMTNSSMTSRHQPPPTNNSVYSTHYSHLNPTLNPITSSLTNFDPEPHQEIIPIHNVASSVMYSNVATSYNFEPQPHQEIIHVDNNVARPVISSNVGTSYYYSWEPQHHQETIPIDNVGRPVIYSDVGTSYYNYEPQPRQETIPIDNNVGRPVIYSDVGTSYYNYDPQPHQETIPIDNVGRPVVYSNVGTSCEVNNNMNDVVPPSMELPPGFRFMPTDAELIEYYLMRKIRNLRLPHDKIKDVDLYQATPDQLTAEYEPMNGRAGNEWYFFTSRNRKYPNGQRPSRDTGDTGYWKATSAAKPILHPNNRLQGIGHKTALVYFKERTRKGVDDVRSNWLMTEYTIEKTSSRKKAHKDDMKLDDWVLCKIYNIGRSSKRNRDSSDVPQAPIQQVREAEIAAPQNVEHQQMAAQQGAAEPQMAPLLQSDQYQYYTTHQPGASEPQMAPPQTDHQYRFESEPEMAPPPLQSNQYQLPTQQAEEGPQEAPQNQESANMDYVGYNDDDDFLLDQSFFNYDFDQHPN